MKFTDSFLQQISTLFRKLFVLLVLYTLCRLLFYIFNYSYFQDATFGQLISIFFFGIRFDYGAIIFYNLLFIVLYLLPFPFVQKKGYRKVVFILFWVVNGFLLLTNFGDIEYFKYTSKRTTADIFKYAALSDDVLKLIPQFLVDFWYIPLLWIITLLAGIRLTLEKSSKNYNPMSFRIIYLAGMILVTGFLFITARGFAMKPLRIISAARYASSQDIPLLINTPFAILHTIQNEKTNLPNFYKGDSYKRVFSPLRQYKAFQKKKDNVVILILESFSQEFIGKLSGKKTYTPFLDSLIGQSLYFRNGFANCRKSIEGIPAVIASLPSLSYNSYISSRYGSNRLEAMPSILAGQGYTTAFFHGGRNGTMGFDEFARIAGIKNYYGMNEYKGPSAFDGNWGISDNEFLHFSAEVMSQFKEPFFSTIFTLSSHHPYTIPANFDKLIPKDEEPQLRTIRYTDMALRNFFRQVSKEPWYNHTLFVIVADHTAKVIDPDYNNPVGTFRIPIVFYNPGDTTLRGQRDDIAQQTDIMPSVLHYLGIEQPFLAYGTSVFSKERLPYAVDFLNGIYYYFENGHILCFDGENTTAVYDYDQDVHLKKDLKNQQEIRLKYESHLKAIIQDFGVRIETNKLFNEYKK